MNVIDAAYSTVHDYPGGAEALGPRLGKRGTSLSAEVRPRQPVVHALDDGAAASGAKLGLLDALKVMQMTADYRMLYSMAAELHHFPPVPMPELEGSELPCAYAVSRVAAEFGLLMSEVAEDLRDGSVSDNELRRIEKAWGLLVASGQQLLQQLGRMNAQQRAKFGGLGRAA